ncbi:hypothetical protein [Aquimarina sp. 2201CG5-10]|uniref:hypothetical protein n=1 Tax=Aquimarina callyspongiae TaxID=3098150 RepID=UPI002AB4C922|nr:hypothetical protein [Aquimarina sp. 2201CG5-10]MDY8138273.1 hypothetical protein [Aquimarina sp. 2201CG5-10]
MTIFIGICFFTYIADRYEGGFRLFVAACCCVFVNALLPINELFYYNKVFTVLINIAEMGGMYFFMLFLIEVKPKKIGLEDTEYF